MKNVLLSLSIVFVSALGASAQILTSAGNKDSSVGYYGGGTSSEFKVYNNIKSGSSAPVYLKWNVTDHSFGPGWDIGTSGVCDNQQCYSSISPTNNLFVNKTVYKSGEYSNAAFSDFHIVFGVAAPAPAVGSSAFVRVSVRDTVSFGSAPRTLTFIAYRATTGVATIKSSDDVVIYPIPARDAVNVVFDESAGIRTIAVYNLIGKLMGPIYKPATNGSAKIDIADMPNGIYFLRLMDATGRVVATRRFTKQ